MVSQLPEGWTIADVLDVVKQERMELDPEELEETNNLSIKDIIFAFKLS